MPGARAPSTLPPPPFQHEAEVDAVEWWLDAHMSVASSLSLVEQRLEGVKLDGAKELAHDLAELRDALYELYCDAADERMRVVTSERAPFTTYIKALYRASQAALGHLVALATVARAPDATLDWAPLRAEAEHFADATLVDSIRVAVMPLAIDVSSPIEPLRNLHKDLASTFAAARAVADRLSRLG